MKTEASYRKNKIGNHWMVPYSLKRDCATSQLPRFHGHSWYWLLITYRFFFRVGCSRCHWRCTFCRREAVWYNDSFVIFKVIASDLASEASTGDAQYRQARQYYFCVLYIEQCWYWTRLPFQTKCVDCFACPSNYFVLNTVTCASQ